MDAGVTAMKAADVEDAPKNMAWRLGGAAGASGKTPAQLSAAYSKAQSDSGALSV